MHSGQCSEQRRSVATPRFEVREFLGTCDLKRDASMAQNRNQNGIWANTVGMPRQVLQMIILSLDKNTRNISC
jgi:hypothetical protein